MMSLGLDKDYGEFGQCLFLNSSSNAVNVSKPLNLFKIFFQIFIQILLSYLVQNENLAIGSPG